MPTKRWPTCAPPASRRGASTSRHGDDSSPSTIPTATPGPCSRCPPEPERSAAIRVTGAYPGRMREFLHGVRMLGRGFGWWGRRPGVMLLGLIPAAIVGLVLLGGLVALAMNLEALTDAMTPFADGWPSVLAATFRLAVGTA